MYEAREAKKNFYRKYQKRTGPRGGWGVERSKFDVLLCDHAATCCQGHYGGGLILVCGRGGRISYEDLQLKDMLLKMLIAAFNVPKLVTLLMFLQNFPGLDHVEAKLRIQFRSGN
jgi:hypothetical protein